jgi:hypothetical protein
MSTVTAPEGYTVCRTSTRFEVINAGDTCIWNDMHLRKVSAAHAVEVGAPADRQSQYFVGHRSEVWQTFKRADIALQSNEPAANTASVWRAPVELVSVALGSEISETAPRFESRQSIRLTILPGIEHEAQILRHHQDDMWHVEATISGRRFHFIAFEDQIITMQRYLVTGLSRCGVADDGSFGFTPQAVVVEAHDAVEARRLAKSVHNDYYQIVTCMRMAQQFVPEFFDDEGKVAFY